MNLIARLEQIPLGRFHYRLLWVTGFGWLFDAMDTGIIAFILPVLSKAWNLTAAQMGYLGSASLVGMACGAVIAGSIADRFGRKRVFMATMFLYSLATGLCGFAENYTTLLLLRFLVGFGLGGELPVAATLVTEYAPPACRGRFIVLLESFWGLGWLAAALISYLVIPYFGWQSAFFIGAVPAVYTAFVRSAAPESVRYLLNQGRQDEAAQIVENLERAAGMAIAGRVSETASVTLPVRSAGLKELWRPEFIRRTLVLWVLWFGIVFSYYGIFTWLPSLMVGQGFAVLKTFEYVLIMTLAQLPGYYTAAYLIDRIGRKTTLTAFLTLCAVAAFGFGQSEDPLSLLIWGSLMSFFNLGAWGVVYTYTPELYPTHVRACGSGWAAAIGRIGGMAAPAIVGILLGGSGSFVSIFTMFTVVMLAVAIVVQCAGEETKQQSLDSISARKIIRADR